MNESFWEKYLDRETKDNQFLHLARSPRKTSLLTPGSGSFDEFWSKKMGTKDIIKVEDRELNQDELNRLALVAPDARVAIIRAYSVAEKMTIELGDEVTNVVRCTFSNCITTNPREPLAHRLKVMSREPLELRCHYCGRPQDLEELIHNLL